MAILDNLRALGDQPVIGSLVRRLAGPAAPLVPVIRLSGVIGGQGGLQGSPLRPSLTLAGVAGDIEQAFSMSGARAVALAINSPGGAPVQAALIMRRIRQLAAEKELPVYAFIEDVGASGGYMLALAGDEIYADENSIVGSIGVISAGFGFTGLIARIGVERRVYTAGENKAMLDPFLPEDHEDVAHLKALQTEVHESFKRMVRERRGGKLTADEKKLFSGAFWTGATAKQMGLVDGLGDMRAVLRARFGERMRLKLVNSGPGLFPRRHAAHAGAAPHSPQAGGPKAGAAPLPHAALLPDAADLVENGLAALEARALWARYGL